MAALAESEAVSMSDNIKWGKRRRFEKSLVEILAIPNIFGNCKRTVFRRLLIRRYGISPRKCESGIRRKRNLHAEKVLSEESCTVVSAGNHLDLIIIMAWIWNLYQVSAA